MEASYAMSKKLKAHNQVLKFLKMQRVSRNRKNIYKKKKTQSLNSS